MRPWIITVIAALFLCGGVRSQNAGDPNEGLTIAWDSSSGAYSLSWWAKAGRTYFIQQSSDLINWSLLPVMESGSNEIISWGYTSTANQNFFRLQYADTTFADWETQMGLDPSQWTDPLAYAPNSSGLTILQSFQLGYSPTATDSDGDGVPNDQDIDPLDPDLNQPRVPETQYAVIDLGTLGLQHPVTINDSLQILDTPTFGPPRLWDSGQFWAFTNPVTDVQFGLCLPYLSNSGEIVDSFGQYDGENATVIDVVSISAAGVLSYSNPEGQAYSCSNGATAHKISASGMVLGDSGGVGQIGTEDDFHGFSYSCGMMWDAAGGPPTVVGDVIITTWDKDGTYGGTGSFFYTHDVNQDGFVVGWAESPGGFSYHAALWYETTESLSSDPYSMALSINSSASPIAVGYAGDSGASVVMWAFVDTDWKQKDLGLWDPSTKTRSKVYGASRRSMTVARSSAISPTPKTVRLAPSGKTAKSSTSTRGHPAAVTMTLAPATLITTVPCWPMRPRPQTVSRQTPMSFSCQWR